MVIKIAIIGTAGRKADGVKMSHDLFESVVHHAKHQIERIVVERNSSLEDICLVSGGSAWIDHVAVRLFLEAYLGLKSAYGGLQLYLPCKIEVKGPRIFFDYSSDCGRRLQQLHHLFAAKVSPCFNPMQDIVVAQSLGGVIDTSNRGFHARNNLVADVDIILAYTWGDCLDKPADGGTADTWGKSRAKIKLHFPLNSILHPQTDSISAEQTQPHSKKPRTMSEYFITQNVPSTAADDRETKCREERT